MPGSRGHRNEDGGVVGKLTLSPKVKRELENRNRPFVDRSSMNRRERIRIGMGAPTGGTEAPSPRRKQIREGLTKGLDGARTLPAGLPPVRYPDPMGNGQKRLAPTPRGSGPGARLAASARNYGPTGMRAQGGSPGVGSNMQPKLGAQLSNRVQSGAINQGQAGKVAQQRRMLQKAFGPDWRKQVFGAGGAKGVSGPFAQAQIRTKRAQGLARAKRKLY